MTGIRFRPMIATAALACGLVACRAETPAPRVIDTAIPQSWPHSLTAAVPTGVNGAIASDDSVASEIGLAILRQGGNAIDAAVATAFALAVTYPEAGNLGGGGFMVIRTADGTTAALDFREEAPAAATRDMFLNAEGNVDENQSLWSHRSSGVPGAVAGLHAAHARFGRLPWCDVLAPAIRVAREGFVVNSRFASLIADRMDERFGPYPGSLAIVAPGGVVPTTGSVWRNPDIAAVLERIAQHGPADFYTGRTADLIVAEMQRGGGLITHADLAAYAPRWRDPIVFDYRGHTVVSMPPASSGGITVGIMANIVEGWDLNALGWRSPDALHVIGEAMRRAFADRNHYMGDPDFVDIPTARLLSDEHAAAHRATIRMDRATPSMDVLPGRETGPEREGMETTHVSVADREGNAVAFTTTVNFLYGSGIAVTGAGFFLNNTMDDFASKPGTPNAFGLVQGEANAIAPRKRALSAQTPTIVLDASGQPFIITGGRGGPHIITRTFETIVNVIDYDLALPAAIAAPRIHHQHLPDQLGLETGGFDESLADALRARGHDVVAGGSGVGPTLVRRDGAWTAAADPRVVGGWAAAY